MSTKRFMKDFQQQQQYRYNGNGRPPRQEGDVRIDYVPNESSKKNKDGSIRGGEYVDYEEIN